MDNYDKFISKLYDMLIDSEIINFDDKPKDIKEKKERLEGYLAKLDRVQDKALSNDRHIETLRKLYYDRYVIKREDIPEGYFKSLEKRYLDEGHGHYDLVNPSSNIDKQLKEEHINTIIKEQKDSLDAWLDYFFGKDSDYLPMWAKVWAFQGMLKIGNLNEKKDGYGRRSNTAVNPFVSLDAEILGKCVKLLEETFDNNDITDKEIDKIVASGSFQKLYGKLLANKKGMKIVSDEGRWVKYNYETKEEADRKLGRGKEPEYLKLYNSLQGYNTSWCTAGSKETAKSQVCGGDGYHGGDFYVYYTKDEHGEYKIPRIAIRMDGPSIGEIRGVASGQNLESNMEVVLEEKLQEFPDNKQYQKKVHDMKKLTEIYNNHKIRDLTKEELAFLYEINDRILGFGIGRDARIYEIKESRDKRKDLSYILNCLPTEIGFTEEELFTTSLVYYDGSISYEQYIRLKELKLSLPEIIGGNLSLSELTNAENLILPRIVKGCLYLNGLTDASGLKSPQFVGGHLTLYGLKTADNFVAPEIIGGDLCIGYKVPSLKHMTLPRICYGRINYRAFMYTLHQIEKLQQEESMNFFEKMFKTRFNRRGFTSGIYAITLVLIVSFLSVLLGIILLNR